MSDATRPPAIEGWFTTGDEPHLIGSRCTTCGTYVFPPRSTDCPNPACEGTELAPVPLSRRGKVWSYTENRYAPPPPYTATEPFEPFALAAVELETEGLIVLGQVARGVLAQDLRVGMEMVLEIGNLNGPDGAGTGDQIYMWSPA